LDIETFIDRWSGREGGAERANYALFLSELTHALDLPRPEPADSTSGYRFEFPVRGDSGQPLRIDLYKRNAFILEAKQSRWAVNQDRPKNEAIIQPDMFGHVPRIRRGRRAGQDADMGAAFRQAWDYANRLPPDHDRPPFLITCDVGNTFEFYSDFSGNGRSYRAFPDDRRRLVPLAALIEPEIQQLFHDVWERPESLDPALERARVTREVAGYLAEVSKSLEERGHPAERVASFLGRVLFAMFAEDARLLPANSFTDLLTRCQDEPGSFKFQAEDLFARMDTGGFSAGLGAMVRRFNGSFYHEAEAFDLKREEIGTLLLAAGREWREVEPAIFGTLLEQALSAQDRSRLGAHYTPRPYVERLVQATIIDPLREDWAVARATSLARKEAHDTLGARKALAEFHERLVKTRVLDPACGTGNFLYVSLELIKALESEVEGALLELDGEGTAQGFEGLTRRGSDPRTFLGLELNPRAARIAELVLWIGYHQTQQRLHGEDYLVEGSVLQDFENINPPASRRNRGDTCVDALMTHDGPIIGGGGPDYPDRRLTPWPEAEFIVGNPPFIGGKDIRAELGDEYVEALWALYSDMDPGSDFVMYWWDRAADILTRKNSPTKRLGFVTTNSITQVFQRRTLARWMTETNRNKTSLSLVFAVDDHPWTKATRDAAAVRIAMTVAEKGRSEGQLYEIVPGTESGLDSDAPDFGMTVSEGVINADLTVGVDVTKAMALRANDGISSRGVSLHGAGFIVSPTEAAHLGLGRQDRPGLETHIKPYVNGRDITGRSRGKMVIDLFGLTAAQVLARYPEVYQHVSWSVRYDKDVNGVPRTNAKGHKLGREWNNRDTYKDNWWIFGEPRSDFRPALAGLSRYVATVETSKHRTFQFLDGAVLPDNKLLAIASADAAILAVLSSDVHFRWYIRNSGMLGVYDREAVYVKSRCFDPFPFPDLNDAQYALLDRAGEALDAFRKARLAEYPDLTITRLYNALEAHRAGRTPEGEGEERMSAEESSDFQCGSVLGLADLHAEIDRLTLEAYGLPADAGNEAILAHLVALNAKRAAEEAHGDIKWLRPDYQISRFAPRRVAGRETGQLIEEAHVTADRIKWPADDRSRLMMIRGALAEAAAPQPVEAIASRFKGRGVGPEVSRLLSTLERDGQVRRSSAGYALLRAA
jgi:hypothetical protein